MTEAARYRFNAADLIRSSSFRLAASLALLFSLSTILLFAFIYWQTMIAETSRVERVLQGEAQRLVLADDETLRRSIAERLSTSANKLDYAQIFAASGLPLQGNLQVMPYFPKFAASHPHRDSIVWTQSQSTGERVMLVAEELRDGRILVIGRSIDSLDNLGRVVGHALELGLIPALLLALAVGVVLSTQAHARIKALLDSVDRIMDGDLNERLPLSGTDSDLDRLSFSVNSMLSQIEHLLDQAKSTGDNIAHDLRTPLTRVRTRLERACHTAESQAELTALVEQAITGLDQTLRIITALLRIGQIENRRSVGAFTVFDLGVVVREIGDLFEPAAEEKDIEFSVDDHGGHPIGGDRDLLSEAIANLVDNAIKFTPPGGKVRVELLDDGAVPVLRVSDSGPGVPIGEEDAIWKRFYRSDKSRHVEGNGLGLSIVKAVADLHGFGLTVQRLNPGCAFEMHCHSQVTKPWRSTAARKSPV